MIETLLTALAFGTFWFWLLVGIVSIIFIASIEHDHYATPTITAILLGALFWTPLHDLNLSWHTVATVFAGYVLAGVLWSLFKWYRYVQTQAIYYYEKYGATISPTQRLALQEAISVSRNKARLTGWIAWWPWSLIWCVTGDFWNFLYDTMVHAYQKISDHAMGRFTVKEEKSRVKTEENESGAPYNPRSRPNNY